MGKPYKPSNWMKCDKVATLSLGDMESLAINIGVNGASNKYQVQYVSVG